MKIRKTLTAAGLACGIVAGGVAAAEPASAHVVSCSAYDYVVWSNGIPYCFATTVGSSSWDYISRYVSAINVVSNDAVVWVETDTGPNGGFFVYPGLTQLGNIWVHKTEEIH